MNTKSPSPRKNPRARAGRQIGYGKPPRAHQFRPGQSGNPKGRPKGSKNEATILHDLLHRRVEMRDGGRARKITVFEAILLRFTEDALKGNTKTATFLFNRYAALQGGETQTVDDLNEDDHEILEAFIRRHVESARTKKTPT
jgi:hypothetical protein